MIAFRYRVKLHRDVGRPYHKQDRKIRLHTQCDRTCLSIETELQFDSIERERRQHHGDEILLSSTRSGDARGITDNGKGDQILPLCATCDSQFRDYANPRTWAHDLQTTWYQKCCSMWEMCNLVPVIVASSRT